MLTLLRRFAKSPVGLGVFALIIIAFIVTLYQGGGGLGGMSTGLGSNVVSVGGRPIDEAELSRRIQNAIEATRRERPEYDIKQFIGEGGVERTIDLTATGRAFEVFAADQGMVASKKLVDGAIASIPAFYGPTGKFDPATFQQVIAQRKVSEKMLRDDFAREALTKALAIPIAGAARVPAGLVQPYASLLLEVRDGRIAELQSSLFAPRNVPSNAELQAFYRRNLARYTVPERRVIRYATFDRSAVAAQTTPTEAEVTALYTSRSDTYGARENRAFTQIIVPNVAQANALVTKVRGGMTMADAARSEKREALVVKSTNRRAFQQLTRAEVAAAAFAASQGQLAAVARSGLGFHVVRVDAIEAIAARPLATVREELIGTLRSQKETRAIGDLVAAIEDAAGSGTTFDELVRKHGLSAQATPALSDGARALEVPGYAAPPEVVKILKAAFEAEPDDDATVTSLPESASFVLWKLDRTLPAAPRPLAEMRDVIIGAVQNDKGSIAAKAAADAVVAAVNRGTPFDQALQNAGVPTSVVTPVKARRLEVMQAASQRPVPPPLALMFSLPAQRARTLQMPGRAGWFVVRVEAITPGDARTAPRLIETTREQLSGVVGDEYVQQFATAVRNLVGVKKNDTAVARLKAGLQGGNAR